jgi:hypothetical protein
VYNRTSEALEAILSGQENTLSEVVDSLASKEDYVAFATAFLMNVFLRLRRREDNERVAQAFEAQRMERKIGSALCRLVNCFISNFPPGCLHLYPDASDEEVHRLLSLCFTLITLCVHSASLSPLTSYVLDENGLVWGDVVTRMSRSFLCGVGVNPLYQWLQYLKENFETQKSTTVRRDMYKGSANKCSCGYVYIINNCGGPMETRPCPFCGEKIGGSEHAWVPRPGHENLSDQEAIAFIESQLANYKRTHELGYWVFDGGDSSSPALRGLSQSAHTVLHLMSVLQLYFLSSVRLLSATDLAVLVNSKQQVDASMHLEEQVRRDFSALQRVLNTADTHLWWYAVLKRLPEFIIAHQNQPLTLENRSQLEADFNIFLQSFCESPVSVIRQERDFAAMNASNIVGLLDESHQDGYPLLNLFRLVGDPDIETLGTHFELQQLGDKFPLLGHFLKVRDRIAQVPLLIPFIELTNHLREYFDHRIRREEARSKQMEDVFKEDPHSKELFEKCQNVWDWLANQELSYECHHLAPKRFSKKDELLFFLVDKQENGGGMYMAAALIHLAEEQNVVMNGFLGVMEKKLCMEQQYILDLRKVPVQQLQATNAVSYSLASLSDFEGSFLNNPQYGEGKEVVYNFQRLEEQVQNSLEKGRLLTADYLECVSYQFEMLSTTSQHSDLISRLRASIKQRPFEAQRKTAIEQFLTKQDDDSDGFHQKELINYYDSLGTLMCFLRNSPAAPDNTILAFAQKVNRFNICEVFTKPTALSQVPLENIVALYEILECWLFTYSRDFVRVEFTEHSDKLQGFFDSADFAAVLPLEELQQVMMRLVMRLLVADIDARQHLALYVIRPDLWAENSPEEKIEAFANKLQELPMAHSMQLYNYLEECNRKSHGVSEQPQRSLQKNSAVNNRKRGR